MGTPYDHSWSQIRQYRAELKSIREKVWALRAQLRPAYFERTAMEDRCLRLFARSLNFPAHVDKTELAQALAELAAAKNRSVSLEDECKIAHDSCDALQSLLSEQEEKFFSHWRKGADHLYTPDNKQHNPSSVDADPFQNQKTNRKINLRMPAFMRKAVKIVVNGKQHFARPDTCSTQDIITEEFALDNNIIIDRSPSALTTFKLGNGKRVQSVGKAKVSFSLFQVSGSEEYRLFHVLAKCPVPIILGTALIKTFDLFGVRKYLLVEFPFHNLRLPTFKYLGPNRGGIKFTADGTCLEGFADTGSDLDFMSLDCARENNFMIDGSTRKRVMLGDETIVETAGQVTISRIRLSGYDDFDMTFDVLPDLPCDVIFSEEFLIENDIFDHYPNILNSVGDPPEESLDEWLKTIVNLGPIQNFVLRMFTRKRKETEGEKHDREAEVEVYRRSTADKRIVKIKDEGAAISARQEERKRRQKFDRGHEACTHCPRRVLEEAARNV